MNDSYAAFVVQSHAFFCAQMKKSCPSQSFTAFSELMLPSASERQDPSLVLMAAPSLPSPAHPSVQIMTGDPIKQSAEMSEKPVKMES